MNPDPTQFEQAISIHCAPTRVMAAFFDPEALAIWWQAVRSVTTPRPLGVYAIEWAPTTERDQMTRRHHRRYARHTSSADALRLVRQVAGEVKTRLMGDSLRRVPRGYPTFARFGLAAQANG